LLSGGFDFDALFEALEVAEFVNLSAPDCSISEISLHLGRLELPDSFGTPNAIRRYRPGNSLQSLTVVHVTELMPCVHQGTLRYCRIPVLRTV
jgi:hypothetical protein